MYLSRHPTIPHNKPGHLPSVYHEIPSNTAPTSTFDRYHVSKILKAAFFILLTSQFLSHMRAIAPTRPHISGKSVSSVPIYDQIVAPTILISLDGFRHEYLSRRKSHANSSHVHLAPTLYRIARQGAHAPNGMQPVMPSETRPNHWALATGLFPESGGIISNQMYDPVRRLWFKSSREDSVWYNGSPIWHTLRNRPRVVAGPDGRMVKLNENYTTACVFWPGSEVQKYAADASWKYDSDVSYERRVNRAVGLLRGTADDLNKPAQFVTLYFKAVDIAGHRFGPYSVEVDAAIERVDAAVALLLRSLEEETQAVNIVIVSDHGMTEMSDERTCDLESSIQQGNVQDITTSPMGLFLNISTPAEHVYKNIQTYLQQHKECATAFLKHQLPERWHLKNSLLIPPIITMANLGWTVKYPHQRMVSGIREEMPRPVVNKRELKGDHGFDNVLYPDMQSIFLAQGPAFRPGSTVSAMRSVDLYEMLCYIFFAQPAPNNGTLQVTLSSILRAHRN